MIASTIGLDLAKHNFHVHAVDAGGSVVKTAALRRSEMIKFFQDAKPCLVGMEACATAHHWARELMKLGHEVRLIPPSYVKPYVRRGAKNDAADAAAICEAVRRPHMRFVPIKSESNQAFLMLHRARGLLVRQRTMTVCAICLFAGSDGGGRTWATIATLLQTAKMNSVDPQAWLTQTLERLANGWPSSEIDVLMPWSYKA